MCTHTHTHTKQQGLENKAPPSFKRSRFRGACPRLSTHSFCLLPTEGNSVWKGGFGHCWFGWRSQRWHWWPQTLIVHTGALLLLLRLLVQLVVLLYVFYLILALLFFLVMATWGSIKLHEDRKSWGASRQSYLSLKFVWRNITIHKEKHCMTSMHWPTATSGELRPHKEIKCAGDI